MKTFTAPMNMLIEMECLLQPGGADKASWDYFWSRQFDQHQLHKRWSPSLSSNEFSATFTSGNCVEDQKLPSQGLGDLIRRWKCQGSRGLRYNMLQSPWCVMFFFSPVFPHPTGLSAYAQGQLWYCTVQVWAESNTWKTWYRAMDYTS